MLHTVIEPSGLYGSELWGLSSIPGIWSADKWTLDKFYNLADVLEVKRCLLIRKWLKLPNSAPSLPLLHELGCEPVVHMYLRRAVRFNNALVDLEEHCAYRGALRQNVEDALGAHNPAQNFVRALFQALRILLPTERGLRAQFNNGQHIDASAVEVAIATRYLEHVTQMSTVRDGLGSRLGLYFRVVGTHALGTVPEYYRLPLSNGVLIRFLRFRLGCHHLRVHTGRWVTPFLPRRQRVCLRCSSNSIDDEAHCLLVCSHPNILELRQRMFGVIPIAFRANVTTYAQFWDMLDRLLVRDMVFAGVKLVAACARVAWSCHESGDFGVAAELPDVLVNTDAHLDLFDSESESGSDLGSLSHAESEELVEIRGDT
jgi:hypothetical protein